MKVIPSFGFMLSHLTLSPRGRNEEMRSAFLSGIKLQLDDNTGSRGSIRIKFQVMLMYDTLVLFSFLCFCSSSFNLALPSRNLCRNDAFNIDGIPQGVTTETILLTRDNCALKRCVRIWDRSNGTTWRKLSFLTGFGLATSFRDRKCLATLIVASMSWSRIVDFRYYLYPIIRGDRDAGDEDTRSVI